MMDAFFRGGRPPVPKEKLDKSSKNERKNVPWVEKYRPKTIDDVAQQDEVVAVLKKTLEGADVPNMLFYGPPGTGKTSTILAACRDLFGVEMMKTRILELNASDERGINVIREKVKNFADGTANCKRSDGKSCPAFKIIILDEADSMTRPAQAALRRMMEKKTRTTRFCLICNYVSRIIEPITSRCAKFRFKPLEGVVLEDRLKHICERENVVCSPEALQMLMNVSEGDLRKAITLLQSARRLKGEDGVSENDISEIAGLIPQNMLDGLMQSCESDSYEKLSSCLKEIIAEGHSAYQLINQLHDMILFKSDVKDNQKSAICEKIAVVDKCLMDGADEYLQIMDLCAVIMQQICHPLKE